MAGPDSTRESETKRDGFLSYAGEWHASAIGAGVGLAVSMTGKMEFLVLLLTILFTRKALSNSHLRDARKEIAYTLGFLLAGAILGTVLTYM